MTSGSNLCQDCREAGLACDACLNRWLGIHTGNASIGARAWGRSVWRKVSGSGTAPPWPTWDQAKDGARNHAAKISAKWAGADERIKEAFAKLTYRVAGESYEAERLLAIIAAETAS